MLLIFFLAASTSRATFQAQPRYVDKGRGKYQSLVDLVVMWTQIGNMMKLGM